MPNTNGVIQTDLKPNNVEVNNFELFLVAKRVIIVTWEDNCNKDTNRVNILVSCRLSWKHVRMMYYDEGGVWAHVSCIINWVTREGVGLVSHRIQLSIIWQPDHNWCIIAGVFYWATVGILYTCGETTHQRCFIGRAAPALGINSFTYDGGYLNFCIVDLHYRNDDSLEKDLIICTMAR